MIARRALALVAILVVMAPPAMAARPEGSVVEVIQKGYRLGDRVLRPARVVVAAAPAETHEG